MHSTRRLLVVAATILSLAVLVPSVAASSPRSGELHATKECSEFDAGSYCTITSSDLKAIPVDSTILYLQPDDLFTPAGSDVVLDMPGPGNNHAFGHCAIGSIFENPSVPGRCTFDMGTGRFTQLNLDVAVTLDESTWTWYWDGSYSFGSGS